MLRQALCVVLVCTFLNNSALWAASVDPAQTQTAQTTRLKEQVLRIPAGSQIEVRLNNKQKQRGRLGEIRDEEFAMQTMKAGKMEVQNVAFSEVNSVKQVGKHTTRNILIGVGIGLAAAVIVVAILAATVDLVGPHPLGTLGS
jgi:preprotein translocase subunit SecF